MDSSVWGDFFNGHPSKEAEALSELIEGNEDVCTCGVVVSEVFQGLTQDRTRGRLEKLFQELIFLETEGIDPYFRSAALHRKLRRSGITVRSTIDCLIAVIAATNGCYILSKGRDLRRIVESSVLEVNSWPR